MLPFHLAIIFTLLAAVSGSGLLGCPFFQIVSKFIWEGRDSTFTLPLKQPVSHVVISHTEGKSCDDMVDCSKIVLDLQDYYIDVLGWPDIGYNFLIGGDGRVYLGRGWFFCGNFSRKYNDRALSVAFIGNYFTKPPSQKMLDAAKKLFQCSVIKGYLSEPYDLHVREDIECTLNRAPELKRIISKWSYYGGKVTDYTDC